jgi:tetratricopeptide (TPR) repeat protein
MRITTHVDSSFRERPDDPERLEEARRDKERDLASLRESLEEERDELNVTRLGRTLNRLSEYAKLAGDLDEGLDYGREAVDIWEELDRDRAAFLVRLRCVECRFFRGERREALDALDEMVERAEDEPFEIYRDFVLEVRGRCRCADARIEAGSTDLQNALEIRRERGNDRLIEQTRHVLDTIEAESRGDANGGTEGGETPT